MCHTSTLLAFPCSHAINPTIAWCKSQLLENALSHHIISAVLFTPWLVVPNGNTLSDPSLLTHTLALFTIPVISSSCSHTGCHCSQAGSSTMTSAHKTELKGGLEFLKGSGKWRACVCVCETETDRETGGSFTVHHHFKS